MCKVKVHTLAITTTMGAMPTVRLWTIPALSSIPLSSDRTSVEEIIGGERERDDKKAAAKQSVKKKWLSDFQRTSSAHSINNDIRVTNRCSASGQK